MALTREEIERWKNIVLNDSNEYTFKNASEEIRDNKEIAMAAVYRFKWALEFVSPRLQDDSDVVKLALEKYGEEWSSIGSRAYSPLRHASDRLKNDPEIVMLAFDGEWGFDSFREVGESSLKDDSKFIMASIKKSIQAFAHASPRLKKDPKIVMAALNENGNALQYADPILQKDPKIVMAAVNKSGNALQYADPILQKDPDIVIAALKSDPISIKHVDPSIKGYKNFVNIALEEYCRRGGSLDDSLQDYSRYEASGWTEPVYPTELGEIYEGIDDGLPKYVDYLPNDLKQQYKLWSKLKELLSQKVVVTHFTPDLDNVSSIEALERFARENGILQEGEHLEVKRVPAGRIMPGYLNVDTGGHKGSRIEDDGTVVIDGDPSKGINSAAAMLAKLGIYVPEQIVELADTVPNKVNPLESRTALSLIRSASGSTIFRIAEAGLLDKQLTDEQLEEFGLQDAHTKQKAIIENAIEKINRYMVSLSTGEKVVISPEQILGGAPIAYELGANYYASIEQHKSGKGSTFAITSKPGLQLPEKIKDFGEELVKQYRYPDGTSGVFLNPNGQMLIAGGPKNPDFSVEYNSDELISKITELFERYASRQQYTPSTIAGGVKPRKGEIDAVMEETAREATTPELAPETKRPGDENSNPGGDNR